MNERMAIKQYLDIAIRRWWIIVLPMVLGLALGGAQYYRTPKVYRAWTSIKVIPQKVPERLITTTVRNDIEGQVQTIKADLTSDEYLKQIVEEVGLTPESSLQGEELRGLIARLRGALEVQVERSGQVFDIVVDWSDPDGAQILASAFALRYIQQNHSLRAGKAQDIYNTLLNMTEQARTAMDARREALETFRGEHRYELPSYVPQNENQINRDQQAIRALEEQIVRSEQEIERLEAEQRQRAASDLPEPGQEPSERQQLELEVEEAEKALEDALIVFKPAHPEVGALQSRLQAARDRLAALGPDTAAPESEAGGEAPESSLEIQIQNLREDITRKREIQKRQQNRVAVSRRNIERSPEIGIQENKLREEYEHSRREFESSRAKERDAKPSVQMEADGEGASMAVLREAKRPGSPHRPKLMPSLIMGMLLGMGLGALVVVGMEVLDQSYQSEEALAADIDLPLLTTIPNLDAAADTIRKAQARLNRKKRGAAKARRRRSRRESA